MKKPTDTNTTAASGWRLGPKGLLALTTEESDLIDKHRRIWQDFAAGGQEIGPQQLGELWHGWTVAARHGDVEALGQLQKFGSEGNLITLRRIESEGRLFKFHQQHAGNLREHFPAITRWRGELERQLTEYMASRRHRLHDVLGTGNSEDATTSYLRQIISNLDEVLSGDWSSDYQFIGNHVHFLECDNIEDTVIDELLEG